jgi:hypothetical protein
VGVYMYCDDQAAIKQLPLNMRATQIAAEAGQALQVSAAGGVGRAGSICVETVHKSMHAADSKGVPAAQG